jgi:hypothetical protein
VFFVPQDREGLLLVPLVILITVALFAYVGRWAWADTSAPGTARRRSASCAHFSASLECRPSSSAHRSSSGARARPLASRAGVGRRPRTGADSLPPPSRWALRRPPSAQPFGSSRKSFRSSSSHASSANAEVCRSARHRARPSRLTGPPGGCCCGAGLGQTTGVFGRGLPLTIRPLRALSVYFCSMVFVAPIEPAGQVPMVSLVSGP